MAVFFCLYVKLNGKLFKIVDRQERVSRCVTEGFKLKALLQNVRALCRDNPTGGKGPAINEMKDAMMKGTLRHPQNGHLTVQNPLLPLQSKSLKVGPCEGRSR